MASITNVPRTRRRPEIDRELRFPPIARVVRSVQPPAPRSPISTRFVRAGAARGGPLVKVNVAQTGRIAPRKQDATM